MLSFEVACNLWSYDLREYDDFDGSPNKWCALSGVESELQGVCSAGSDGRGYIVYDNRVASGFWTYATFEGDFRDGYRGTWAYTEDSIAGVLRYCSALGWDDGLSSYWSELRSGFEELGYRRFDELVDGGACIEPDALYLDSLGCSWVSVPISARGDELVFRSYLIDFGMESAFDCFMSALSSPSSAPRTYVGGNRHSRLGSGLLHDQVVPAIEAEVSGWLRR